MEKVVIALLVIAAVQMIVTVLGYSILNDRIKYLEHGVFLDRQAESVQEFLERVGRKE